MSEPIISTRGLSKTYGRGRRQVQAVRGLDLDVRRGEIFGLLGPDGAGKTTTIQMLCGLLRPSGGQARVAGVDVVAEPDALGGRIGYMSEGFTLYGSLSVSENLDFFADLYRVPAEVREERIQSLLRFARLEQARDRRAEHLSGGMKKKLALACALLYSPEVLFLDEPTTGVDPVSRRDFWLLLSDFLDQGISIFVSTPYMDEAERFHRVAFVHEGQLIALDAPADLKAGLPGEMLDLLATPQRPAVAALRRDPRVSHVQVFGQRVHLLLGDAGADLPSLEEDMVARGVRLDDVRRTAPGLEDVFVALLERTRGTGGDGGGSNPGQQPEATASAPASDGRPRGGENGPAARPRPEGNGWAGGVAVRVEGLTRTFGTFTAVDRLSFQVRAGEIFGFLGPNGSGKTTTIRMLAGLLAPSAGSGEVVGYDIVREQARIKPEIGYMSQRFSLYPDLTVGENLDLYAGIYGLSGSRKEAREAWVLGMAGLEGRERLMTRELSGGWKQRLALGCAVLHEPRVLFLDEPTSGVDPISRRAFWDLIYDLSGRGVTVFVTTHYMDEAEHCDTLGLIHQGRLVARGGPEELRRSMLAGQMLEVTCPDPLRAVRRVRGLDGVLGAGLFGSRVHVLVEDAEGLAPQLEALLAADGHAPERIAPIPLSLEDLFVIYIEMEDERRRILARGEQVVHRRGHAPARVGE